MVSYTKPRSIFTKNSTSLFQMEYNYLTATILLKSKLITLLDNLTAFLP